MKDDDDVVEIAKRNPFTDKKTQYKPIVRATTPPEEPHFPSCPTCDLTKLITKQTFQIKNLDKHLTEAHTKINALQTELNKFLNDPEFQTIMQYQKMKRQRKQ